MRYSVDVGKWDCTTEGRNNRPIPWLGLTGGILGRYIKKHLSTHTHMEKHIKNNYPNKHGRYGYDWMLNGKPQVLRKVTD